MTEILERTKVLITVMTYPLPSSRYQEVICTAGITDKGEWVRLYPIDYRYRPRFQQFRKYQWIEVELSERGTGNDNRKESRKPNLDSIVILGEPLTTDKGWIERRKIIDKMPVYTVKQLESLYESERTSIGVVKPNSILSVKVEESDREWKPEWQMIYDQLKLFGDPPIPLRKIPYKFSYVFECDDNPRPHNAMIEDWELGVLFLRELDRLGNEEMAAESVRSKYFDEMCSSSKDTRFFMGTTFPYNKWVILGVFWSPVNYQMELGL